MKRTFLSFVAAVFLLSPAFAETGWDSKGVERTAAGLLKKEDFAGLDKLATDIKAKGYDVRQRYPELEAFYVGFKIQDSASDKEWLDQQARLDRWMKAQPDSLSSKIAMAHWYLDYGWKARGTSWGKNVTKEGWQLMSERLCKASEILRAIPEAQIDDPEFYRLWSFLEAEPTHSNKGAGEAAFKAGVAKFKEYGPLYRSRAYFLLPMWFGKEGDFEQFVKDEADTFSPEKGDVLYARVIRVQARIYDDFFYHDDSFFQKFHLDYDRIKRGFFISAQNPRTRVEDLSDLAYLASIHGDKETAKKLILELGPSIWIKGFGNEENFVRLSKACGAEDLINKAREAELAGKIDDAEKMFTSFNPDPLTNPWLSGFYLRQGNEAKLRGLMYSEKQSYAQILDADVATAAPDLLFTISNIAPLVGEWDKAEAAAQLFNQTRPWNITGENTLWLCALRKGDKERVEGIEKELVAMKTNRPAYLTAQAVINGSKTWDQARAELKPEDEYLLQGFTSIVLYYFSIGDRETARKAIEQMQIFTKASTMSALYESMLHGSVGQALNGPDSKGR